MRWFLWLGLGSLLMAASPEAMAQRLIRADRFAVGQRTDEPTFYANTRPGDMDHGRLVYLGRGMWAEQDSFSLIRRADHQVIKVRAPLAAFLETHPEIFPGAKGAGWPGYEVIRLLYYDTEHGQAGILFGERALKTWRRYYLHWDLDHGRITRAELLGGTDEDSEWVEVKPIGYDPDQRTFFASVWDQPRGPDRRPIVSIVALDTDGSRKLVTFRTARKLVTGPTYHDPLHKRAAVVEYAESPLEGPQPQAHLVDLVHGERQRVDVPLTCYGLTFSPDGRFLFAYGNQKGEVWKIDLKTGQRVARAKVGDHAHTIGQPFPGVLLVIRTEGLVFLRAGDLRKLKTIPTTRIDKGWFHPEGSYVTPAGAVISNGDNLYLVDLKRR